MPTTAKRSREGQVTSNVSPVQSRHVLFRPMAAPLIIANHSQSRSSSSHRRKSDFSYHQQRQHNTILISLWNHSNIQPSFICALFPVTGHSPIYNSLIRDLLPSRITLLFTFPAIIYISNFRFPAILLHARPRSLPHHGLHTSRSSHSPYQMAS